MIEKEIIINKSKIRYVEKQSSDEVMFVFLHGWGSDYTIFSPLYGIVNTMVAFDFPGCGKSSKPEEVWNLEEYAKTTKDFLNKITKGKKIIFIAHSFGGKVLLKMLNQGTMENIQQIICIGVPFTRRHGAQYDFLRGCSKIAGRILSHLPESVTRKIKETWHKIIGADDYGALKNDSMRKTFKNILDEDMTGLSGVLKKYRTDFIWGNRDTAAPLSDAAIIAGESEAALHIIKNGDHFPFLGETQEKFIEIFKQITLP